MKLSVSLPDDDVRFIDGYAESQGIGSRSAVLQQAIRLLRAAQLGDAYARAWGEWIDSGEAESWESTTADGLSR